jgi:hypothetical protein
MKTKVIQDQQVNTQHLGQQASVGTAGASSV